MEENSAKTNNSGQVKKIAGIDIYYELHQNPKADQTMVFLHGFLSSSFCFRKIIPKLNEYYTILSVDFPPFGKSGKAKAFTYSYDNIAKTILRLLDILSIPQAILIGHSMGGQICLYMAKLSPERFPKLILLASSGYLRRAKHFPILLSYMPGFYRFIKRQLIRSGGVEGNLRQVVYDPALIDEEMIQGYSEPFLDKDDVFQGLVKLLRDREDDLSSQELEKIHLPVLLIWGKHDKIVPLSTGKRLHRDLPSSKLVVIDDAGHLLPEEKPEMVCERILEFLKEA